MFSFIVNCFNKKEMVPKMESIKCDKNDLFNKQYRNAYNKLWISKLRHYRP